MSKLCATRKKKHTYEENDGIGIYRTFELSLRKNSLTPIKWDYKRSQTPKSSNFKFRIPEAT